jgi:uncharacterized coiled-coil protein SlyX
MSPEIIIIPGSEDITDDIEETGDEIEALSEQLAAHQAASETRHTQIIEGVDSCRTRLETLSSAVTSENPALIQISSQLVALQAELLSLRMLFLASQTAPTIFDPPLTETPEIEEIVVLDSPNEEPSTVVQPEEIELPVTTSSRKTQLMV